MKKMPVDNPVFMDISERKLDGDKLRAQNEFTKLVIDSLTHPFYVINVQDHTIAMSNTAGSAMGEGMTCYAVSHRKTMPCGGEEHACPLEEVKRTKKPALVEHIHYDREGNPRNMEVHCYPIFDTEGNVVQVIEYSLEITERRRAEEMLRQSEEKYRTLYDSSSDAIMLLDEKGFFDCNDSTLRIFGFSKKEDFTKVHPSQVSPPYQPDGVDSLTAANKKIAEAFRKGTNQFEWVHRKKNGEDFFADVLLTAFNFKGKQVLQATVRDISERKKADEELRKARNELEMRVRERTSELAQLLEELKRSNAELEQFAYVASHDLQEPLRMVASYVQLLERRYKGRLDPDADEFIAFAVDGAKRMQDMINSLLQLSRVTTRGKPFEPVDCNTILDQVRFDMRITIEESCAIISHDPLPTVYADASQLDRVFQNLIGNAIKFRDEAHPRIHIGVERKENEWIFSVKDNGIGFELKQSNRLFMMFQRLQNGAKYPGTGMGLAICKKIIERHGGRIWAESEIGKGSIFYFTLPKREDVGLESNEI